MTGLSWGFTMDILEDVVRDAWEDMTMIGDEEIPDHGYNYDEVVHEIRMGWLFLRWDDLSNETKERMRTHPEFMEIIPDKGKS